MAGKASIALGLSHVESIVGPHCEGLVELARSAEAAGADQVVFSEHVTLASVITDEPGTSDGAFPFPGDHQYPEPLITLAAIAAATDRVRLSTNVLITPLRPAVLLAKMVATLDCLSGGRVDLGVGTGWHGHEFAALGVPLEARAQRMDDTIRACKALWRGGPASFSSDTVSFADMNCSPVPVQRDLPIWFGGGPNRATARRIAALGHGWSPIGSIDPDDIPRGVELLHEEFARSGRDSSELGVRIMVFAAPSDNRDELLERYAVAVHDAVARGATAVQIPVTPFVSALDEAQPALTRLIETVR